MKQYSQLTEVQINYVICPVTGNETQSPDYHKYQKYALKQQ